MKVKVRIFTDDTNPIYDAPHIGEETRGICDKHAHSYVREVDIPEETPFCSPRRAELVTSANPATFNDE